MSRVTAQAMFLALLLAAAQPALAQGIDVQNGANTLVSALLVVFGILILGIAGWKGIEAVMDHRSVMPSLIGLVLGIALTFGGAWFIGKMGGTTSL